MRIQSPEQKAYLSSSKKLKENLSKTKTESKGSFDVNVNIKQENIKSEKII